MVEYINFKSPIVANIKFFGVSSLDVFSRYGIYAALAWFFRRQGELNKQIVQKELEEEKLKRELLQTRYAVLNAQINPHFLFNVLNFIHSKAILSNDPDIDKAVLLLSEILRHSLRDNARGHRVSIDEEIDQIRKLCELHRLRFNGEFYFDITQEGTDCNRKIPVLILLTFFENAMKYGVYDNPEYPIILQVEQSAQLLEISLKNKIRNVESVNNQTKFSIGKRYIKNTLEQFYKNSHILDYHDDGIYHTVHLKIYE
ncbi:sensor histidine kinase [Sphingobacterium faecale]|uniref:Histidine kinase n=1 Tax=Sphingobacterium faecale TaxID=2803775 RepID=A0ABS1R0W0_9SPHI|nr:histidine kinase [Sphingobacterium faecale]MBL1408209.1 histidine kinase [Sphingobacterium faecale]